MLQLYNLNKVKTKGLTQYKDYCIESTLSTGDKVLSFLYPSEVSDDIKEEGYIRTKTDEFVIKLIEDKGYWKYVKATINVEDLEGQVWEHFNTTEQTIEQCLNLAVAGTWWTVQVNGVTKRRTIRKTNCSTWDIIQQAKKTYLVEIEFDTINKIVKVAEKLGSDKGVYFMDSLNLRSLDIQSNSYEFYTRLIAIGKGDLKVTVENFQYSSKRKTLIWKDERYTDINSLTEDATAKLVEISKPYRAYGADIIDLASTSDKYNILSYSLGDTITLISKEKGIKEKQRIVKITEYPEEPERNSCEIANTIVTFADIQKEYQEATQTVNNITSDNGTISEGAIKVAVEQITINKADIQDLNAVNARVGTLEVTTATITQLNASNARIDDLFATKATIIQLNAASAKIEVLESKAASIDTLVAGNLTAKNMQAGFITAESGLIANGAIKDAMILNLSVSKILAGDISTSKFRVVSDSGNMLIFDNTIQIKDSSRVRVQIGKDASSDYNMYVWDSSGNLMFDATGLKASGIKSKIIRDDMVSDTANIDGKKLNINTVVSSINGATTLLKASKINLDTEAQTLDLAFTSLKSTVTSTSNTVTSQGTAISAIQGQISSKIWQQDITTSINNLEIGGRNLLRNSSFIFGLNGADWIPHEYAVVGTGKSISIRNDAWSGNEFALQVNIATMESGEYGVKQTVKTVVGKQYVLSGYIAGHRSNKNIIVRDSQGWLTNKVYAEILGGEDLNYWTKFEIVFTARDNFASIEFVIINTIAPDGYIWLKKVKLEEGSKATAHTEAPEDTEEKITTITNNYSALNQTVNSINANVSSLQTTTNNLGTRVASAEGSLSILQNQITLKVSQTDIDNSINNIHVGGRNYFVNSQRIINTGDGLIITPNHPECPYGFHVTGDQDGNNWLRISNVIKSNGYWTVSWDMKGTQYLSIPVKVDICDLGVTMFTSTYDNSWKRFSLTVNVTNYGDGKVYNFVDFENFGWYYYLIRNIKVERGNKSTDWTAAPEDVDQAISAVDTKVSTATSEIDVLKNQISLKVNTTDFNSLSGRVSTAESNINQQANQISSKVDVNGLSSLIQQRPNDVLIAFNSSTTSGLVDIKNGNLKVTSASGKVGIELDNDGTLRNHWGIWSIADTANYEGTFKLSDPQDKLLMRPWGISHAIGSTGATEKNLLIQSDYGVDFRNISGMKWGKIRTGTISTMWSDLRDETNRGLVLNTNAIDSYAPNARVWINYNTAYHPAEGASLHVGNGWNSGGYGSLYCGDLKAYGTKNCIQRTQSFGDVAFYADESTESWLRDKGFGFTTNGECIIWIDSIVKESLNLELEYHVKLDKYGPGDIYTIERTPNYFKVKSEYDIRFGWTLEGKRRGFENRRLQKEN